MPRILKIQLSQSMANPELWDADYSCIYTTVVVPDDFAGIHVTPDMLGRVSHLYDLTKLRESDLKK